jgi:uncharacterized protein
MSNRITHFEIPSDNPEKAMEFYKKVFQWQFVKFGDDPYWLVMTGDQSQPGINGGLMKKRDPRQPVVNSISVNNIDETIKSIEEAGGKIVVPKIPIPSVGWLAYFMDTDANIHGIMQDDKEAK